MVATAMVMDMAMATVTAMATAKRATNLNQG